MKARHMCNKYLVYPVLQHCMVFQVAFFIIYTLIKQETASFRKQISAELIEEITFYRLLKCSSSYRIKIR